MFRALFISALTAISYTLVILGPNHLWADQLSVFVSVAPQKYFVQQIGKDLVDVKVMVPPGASPATYEPKPQQMRALAKADAYFAIGVPFEKAWLSKIVTANPQMQMVATDQGIEKLAMAKHAHGHKRHDDHDNHGHHDEAGLDPHIWTSPPLVMIQAKTILKALQALDPAHATKYAANHKTFAQTLLELDNDLKAIFHPLQGRHFMVFHPSWGYFARAYGLVQVPVEIEGKAPKPAQLKRLITHARANGIKVIFAQPQFSTKSALLIAKAVGGRLILSDPLALDWADNLRRQAQQFMEALR